MVDTRSGRARLSEFLNDLSLPKASLLELTGDRSKIMLDAKASRRSGLEIRLSSAWQTPLDEITCAQCRVLVGQTLGLQWLSEPVATFVTLHPKAECDLYCGDLSVAAIIAWREMSEYAPNKVQEMISSDFEWLRLEAEADEWTGSILKKAVASLDEALKEQRPL